MYLSGSVHIENFERVTTKIFNPGERYENAECGVIVTLIDRPNSAGSMPSGIVGKPTVNGALRDDDTALRLGDQSEMRVQFKNQSGKIALIENLKFQWARYQDFTKKDEELDAADKAANIITFSGPIRMEIRREGKAFAWNEFTPPVAELTTVDLKNMMLDELIFTTSRQGKVYFDNFNWTIV